MHSFQLVIVSTVALVAFVEASGCPRPSQIPHQLCARIWKDTSCSSDYYDVSHDKSVKNMGGKWNDQASLIVVHPRCQFSLFQHYTFTGNSKTYHAGIHDLSKSLMGVSWGKQLFFSKRMSSFKCKCSFTVNPKGCPLPSNLPVMVNRNDFLCARMWADSNSNKFLSCYGAYLDVPNARSYSNLKHWSDRVSSLVVRPGCKLSVYEKPGYQGFKKTFTGVVHNLATIVGKHPGWKMITYWDNQMSSLSCKCSFSNAAIRCKPSDKYRKVVQCNNKGSTAMSCRHALQSGIIIGSSIKLGLSGLSTKDKASVVASIKATMKAIFKHEMKVSTTNYDWSQTSSSIFKKATVTNVACPVAPGEHVEIIQVVGKCGETTVYPGYHICKKVYGTKVETDH